MSNRGKANRACALNKILGTKELSQELEGSFLCDMAYLADKYFCISFRCPKFISIDVLQRCEDTEAMDKKRVMIVAHFCGYGKEKTNNRFNYLAEFFVRKGLDVEVVTSSFSHKDKTQRKVDQDFQKGYKIRMVYEPSYKRNVSVKRLLISHPTMARNLRKYLTNCERPDLIYCAIPSVDVAAVAAGYARKRGIPFVLDVQDLWPEAYRLVLKNDILYNAIIWLLKWKVNKVYASADRIIAVSNTYAQRAKIANKKSKEAITAYLGTEVADFVRNVAENTPRFLKPKNEFWLGYCGTLGHSYDLTTVLDAMKLVADRGIENIRLVVMGNGPWEEKFKQKAVQLGVQCIFTGKLPYAQMCAQLAQCDVAVNPIAAGAAQSIINKHADYAVAGLPVINTQENEEYRNLLQTYGCGISCEPADVQAVAEGIALLAQDEKMCCKMRENARKMGLEKFDRAQIYNRILQAIQEELC